jgi:hypothetical protein
MSPKKARKKFDEPTIQQTLEKISQLLSGPVEVFLIGGLAMMQHQAKAATKDIDLVFKDKPTAALFVKAAREAGYKDVEMPLEYQNIGSRYLLENSDAIRLDIFVITICNALSVTTAMLERAKPWDFLGGLTLLTASREDIFLFKAITNRDDDLIDMASLQSKGLDWDTIEKEIHNQKDSWVWLNRVYARLLEYQEEKGISSPLIKRLEKDAEVYQAMGMVLEKLEDGPMGKNEIKALLKEEDADFIDAVILELVRRELVNKKKGKLDKKKKPSS